MSVKVDQFCDNLHGRLHAIEERVDSVKTSIQAMPKQADKALHEKLDQARQKLQAGKARAEQARTNLKAHIEQKVTESKEAVAEWKAKRETRKLEGRADRAEAYATDSVEFALAVIDQAEEAILDAVIARKDADAAQAPAAR